MTFLARIDSNHIHEQARVELTDKHTIEALYICLIDNLDFFNTLSI